MHTPNFSETQFDVFVPLDARAFGIDPTSAVVAGVSQRGKPQLIVHLESNRYGAENMRQFAQRCVHAAGRAATHYPTIAKVCVPAEALVRVAGFDLGACSITEITDAAQLQAWIGDEPLPVVGQRARG